MRTLSVIFALFLIMVSSGTTAVAQDASVAEVVLRGQRLTVTAGQLDSDGISAVTPASVCLETSGLCFHAPDMYGLNPKASIVELGPNQSALLFKATASAGGSGSSTLLALLDVRDGRFVNLLPAMTLSEQSEFALWREADVSEAPVLVTADYVWGEGETHFAAHRFRIRAFVRDTESAESALPSYVLRAEFVTDDLYPSLDEVTELDVLVPERANVLARLRQP